MEATLPRRAQRPMLHLGLLALTLAATFVTFLIDFTERGARGVHDAVLFSLSVVAILGSHEMGHWLLARRHGVDASLPYFIPVPLLGFGTLGAVIRVRDRIPSRNALVDIGAAGPIAGFVLALPILAYGYVHSTVVASPVPPVHWPAPMSLWSLVRAGLGLGAWPNFSAQAFGDSALTLLLARVTLGPLPPGTDVLVHPCVLAGWFGLVVTMLNLVPIGQLDGGHLTYALFGKRARTLGFAAALAMALGVLVASVTWALWLVLVCSVVRFGHPPLLRPDEPLARSRVWVCVACLLIFAVSVMPLPIVVG